MYIFCRVYLGVCAYVHVFTQVCVSIFLSIEVISLYVGGDLCFPLVPVVQQLLFVVQQLLVGLCGELKVGALEQRGGGTGVRGVWIERAR